MFFLRRVLVFVGLVLGVVGMTAAIAHACHWQCVQGSYTFVSDWRNDHVLVKYANGSEAWVTLNGYELVLPASPKPVEALFHWGRESRTIRGAVCSPSTTTSTTSSTTTSSTSSTVPATTTTIPSPTSTTTIDVPVTAPETTVQAPTTSVAPETTIPQATTSTVAHHQGTSTTVMLGEALLLPGPDERDARGVPVLAHTGFALGWELVAGLAVGVAGVVLWACSRKRNR